ncbi:hypothetical protein JYT84_00690 [bacterium AH-315-M10]|nr:hypothetical protein [bacterium AH-315-M10]
MTGHSGKTRLLMAGWRSDLDELAGELDRESIEHYTVTEDSATHHETPDGLKSIDVVVYVMSEYTYSSSQLCGACGYVNHWFRKGEEYLLAFGKLAPADLREKTFPALSQLPTISLEEFRVRFCNAR